MALEPNTARWSRTKFYQVRQGKCANGCGTLLNKEQLVSRKTGKSLKYPTCDRCRTKLNELRTRSQRTLRLEAINHYGGSCACCGETRLQFLAIDHIDGGGRKHRQQIIGYHIEAWLKKQNWPSGFRILCHNCNMALGFYGVCPHESEQRNVA